MKNRVGFGLWIIVLGILWLPGKLQYISIILAATVLAAIIAAIWAGYTARHIKFDFELTGSHNGEKIGEFRITSNYGSQLPIKITFKMQSENCLTGEKKNETFSLMLQGMTEEIEIKCNHAGKLQLQIEKLYITDFLGLFSFRVREIKNRKLTCLLLPSTAGTISIPEIAYGYGQDSDTYAEDRPGTDYSQTYELRDYRNGDSMRTIHWKLSSRSENWIVRTGSLPVGHRLILLLENSYAFTENDEKAKQAIEQACANLIALSEDLTDKGITHHIGWWNKETEGIQIAEIQSAEALMPTLGRMLGATLEKREKTIWERFLEEYEKEEFSQVIVIDDETTKNYRF